MPSCLTRRFYITGNAPGDIRVKIRFPSCTVRFVPESFPRNFFSIHYRPNLLYVLPGRVADTARYVRHSPRLVRSLRNALKTETKVSKRVGRSDGFRENRWPYLSVGWRTRAVPNGTLRPTVVGAGIFSGIFGLYPSPARIRVVRRYVYEKPTVLLRNAFVPGVQNAQSFSVRTDSWVGGAMKTKKRKKKH